MAVKIDLNCDMGESFGMYKMGLDEEVIKHISSANVACGFHAGDPMWMRHTVRLAEEHGVAVGAHPSFPDLNGFGRRNMSVEPEEAKNDVVYQIGALSAFTAGGKLQHVKPHGAMYNQAVSDEALARAICEAVLEVDEDMVLLVLAGSPWERTRGGYGPQGGKGDIRRQGAEPGRLAGIEVQGGVGHSRRRRGGGAKPQDGDRE